MLRAKNEAQPRDVCKLLRAHVVCLDSSKFCIPDLDAIASNFQDFLSDLCEISARPTGKLLQEAARLAFEGADLVRGLAHV